MDATPPFPVISSQRQLAVIMFTDAVGFSAKMHEQEIATLNRIERDTEVMKRIFGNHSGNVLKSTGDGLLIQFLSAADAVACALEIQRFFTSRTDPTYAASALRYRIGIHLGDVFVGNGDVMGDGVNIAARLMNQSPPDGIIISQTVYDVVKNKLPLHVRRLGPQKLKNIAEPITLYRVLLEEPPPAPAAGAVPSVATKTPVPAAVPVRSSRKGLIIFLLVVIPGVALLAHFFLQQKAAHEEEMTRSQSGRAELEARLKENSGALATVPAARPAGRDFASQTTRTAVIDSTATEGAATRLAAVQSTEVLIAWLSTNLMRYTRERPLQVDGLGSLAVQRTVVFLDSSNHQLVFTEGGASRRMEWTKLKPAQQAAIIVSALRQSPEAIPAAVRQGADAFAYLHGFPEMIAALPR